VTLEHLRAQFSPAPGYLNAATNGLPMRGTVDAMAAAIADWQAGAADLAAYDEAVAAARSAFARIVGAPVTDVAIGAHTATSVGLVAASLPAGAEVLTVDGDFTSVTYPFLARSDLRVRAVPLAALAGEVTPGTAAVAFSLVQSKDGAIADVDAVTAAARDAGALTVADLTQAAGWLPVDAARFDVTVTSAYKWLCAPRGTAFLTAGPAARERLRPVFANWYAGEDVWTSVYGHDMRLSGDARRFDLSPAWLCWVGAVPALEAFADELAGPDPDAIRRHDVALADRLRTGLGTAPGGTAIVSLPDPTGDVASRLAAAGLRTAGRGGCARLAFHVWNDDEDVAAALAALH
jgi:selenocysteine lyase/cysteine desulfurase